MNPRLFLITGERGAGKSTVCARVAALLREKGVDVQGVVTERVAGAGEDSVREAVDLATGVRRPFGRRRCWNGAVPAADAASGVSTTTGGMPSAAGASDPLTPGWRYEEDVFRRGNEVFERARGCEVLVVDELGPVEILGRRGWSQPLETLIAGDFKTAVVVCRPGLLGELVGVLGRDVDRVYEVTVDRRDELPDSIAARIVGSEAAEE
jgi:nucleoside-triphosphatase THEP1